jgi:hypothetical protein
MRQPSKLLVRFEGRESLSILILEPRWQMRSGMDEAVLTHAWNCPGITMSLDSSVVGQKCRDIMVG